MGFLSPRPTLPMTMPTSSAAAVLARRNPAQRGSSRNSNGLTSIFTRRPPRARRYSAAVFAVALFDSALPPPESLLPLEPLPLELEPLLPLEPLSFFGGVDFEVDPADEYRSEYQPPPLRMKLPVPISRFAVLLPHLGHFLIASSVMRCSS